MAIACFKLVRLALFIGLAVQFAEGGADDNSRVAEGKKSESVDLSRSPSITSVHQVWTSSSSERLDELSPEVVGKLHHEVPFLTAYALRPRLVGAITSHPSGSIKPLDNFVKPMHLTGDQVLSSDSTEVRPSIDVTSRLLGDFSEIKLETSSTSKSEHHHKKQVGLKKKPSSSNEDNSSKRADQSQTSSSDKRKRLLRAASQLITQRRTVRHPREPLSKSDKKRNYKTLSRAGRLRRKLDSKNLQHHLDIIKHGRLQTRTGQANFNDGEVKGGSNGNEPNLFYQRKRSRKGRKEAEFDSTENNDLESNGRRDDVNSSGEETNNESDDERAELPLPKRVGDDDVEPEGDTVAVIPKSDGVDDDPDPMDYEDRSLADDGDRRDNTNGSFEPRVSRVNRDRDNDDLPSSDADDDSSGGPGSPEEPKSGIEGRNLGEDDFGAAGGAGIGGTVNGARGGSTGHSSGSEGSQDQEKPNTGIGYADEDSKGNEESVGESDKDRNDERTSAHQPSKSGADDVDEPDDRGTKAQPESEIGQRPSSQGIDDHANDKGLEPGDRRQKTPKGPGLTSSAGHDEGDDDDAGTYLKPGQHRGRGQSRDHCEHSSFHHDHHHHHHNSIQWLRDAVPGEPGYDYPILGRTNATNFRCADQKYPGYYADVDHRCQVFHICQDDGRQSSFLCPNGTIFNQKTTVCVWWDSFECEDAPKYYDLNALLYKTSPIGTRRPTSNEWRPEDLANQDDEPMAKPAIVELLDAMKRRRSMNDDRNFSNEEDEMMNEEFDELPRMVGDKNLNEATVQHKSNEPTDKEPVEGPVSSSHVRQQKRLRRKRRANGRRAPPKLKSRRVTNRTSRRWKLRHGIKPKRRA